jgi:hypothetical protein
MKRLSLVLALLFSLSTTAFAGGYLIAAGSGSGGAFPPVKENLTPNPEFILEEEAPAESSTISSATSDSESEGVCYFLEDLRERISCRLQKDHQAMEEELKRYYLPEECRFMDSGSEAQESCIDRYQDLLPCWDEGIGPDRISCVKAKLELPQTLLPISEYCGVESETCEYDYRHKVYHLITFRFYDAEERVEEWYEEERISLEDAVEFIAFIAESKNTFNQAQIKIERVEVIKSVIEEWGSLVNKLSEV